jgi:hypothetical protein
LRNDKRRPLAVTRKPLSAKNMGTMECSTIHAGVVSNHGSPCIATHET